MKSRMVLQDKHLGRVKPSTARVYGRHVYGSAYECDIAKLTNEEFLRETVVEAVKVGNMRLLEVKSWKIGLGVSVVAVILESHVSVHTWPEYGFATIDVYSCGEHTDPERAFYFIAERLGAERVELGILDRSLV